MSTHPKTVSLVSSLCFQSVLRRIIKSSGKTQKEAGASAGLTEQEISRVVHGRRKLSPQERHLLLMAVGVSVQDFLAQHATLQADKSVVEQLLHNHDTFVAAKRGMRTLGLSSAFQTPSWRAPSRKVTSSSG